jgi:hypothetical protein
MASTREQLRSEISFRDEVIRVSCLKGRTEKLDELSPFTDGMAYAPAGSASSQIVSALGSVEIQDSQIRKSVIQAPKGVWHAPIRFDRRPVGEDGAALFR